MSIIDWFNNLLATEAKHYVFAPIPSDIEEIEFQEGQHYFRLRLAEMFLKEDRKLFHEYVPVVSSAVELRFGDNAAQQLPCVVGPLALNLGESSLGKGVQLNYSLTNLVPYHGGNVAISAALLAYVDKDYFQEFLSMVNSISGLLTIGQLSTTLKVVDSAVNGIQELFHAGDKEIRLVFHNEYSGEDNLGGISLKNGYFAVIDADASHFATEKLFIKNSQLQFGDDPESAKPLTGYDYMLFRVEAALARDDFRYFAEYNNLLYTAIEKGMADKAEGDVIIKAAMLAVFKSDDLTYVDKTRVAAALKQEYEDRISFKGKLKGASSGQWLNDRVLAFDPETVWWQISPLFTKDNLDDEAVADKIFTMVMDGRIKGERLLHEANESIDINNIMTYL